MWIFRAMAALGPTPYRKPAFLQTRWSQCRSSGAREGRGAPKPLDSVQDPVPRFGASQEKSPASFSGAFRSVGVERRKLEAIQLNPPHCHNELEVRKFHFSPHGYGVAAAPGCELTSQRHTIFRHSQTLALSIGPQLQPLSDSVNIICVSFASASSLSVSIIST
jgi:hypothetical protein